MQDETLTFLLMADPQFGMYTGNKDFAQETANYEFAVAAANRLKPRFVVICGDLINKPGDPAQTAEYLRITRKLTVPYHHVAGNHDVENEPTPEALAAYRKTFGPDRYAFAVGGTGFLVINSSLIHSPGKAPDEYRAQETWIAAELDKLMGRGLQRLIVFSHHPFFVEAADEKDQYFNIPLERRRPLLERFHHYGVTHIFAGHYHRNAVAHGPGLEMITTGPVGKPLGGAKSGFRVVTVSPAGVTHKFHDFGDLP